MRNNKTRIEVVEVRRKKKKKKGGKMSGDYMIGPREP